jgi:protein TonB
MSRLRGEQGVVVLELAVGTDGRVVTARVARSSGFLALDDAARRAAQEWRFRPALLEGQPTLATIQTAVQFRLE